MKQLTILTAAVALIAGISVASAANSMDKSNSMSKSAQVTGTGKFCIKGASGALNCEYASMSACNKAKTGSESCEANPGSTTGAATKN